MRARDPERALELYLASSAELDPRDGERVTWLAEHFPRHPELEALFRAAVVRGCDEARWKAALALGEMLDPTARPGEARPFYEIVVREARDADPRRWVRACVNLAQAHRLLGGVFECLVLARLAAREGKVHGEARAYAVARLHIVGALADLQDTGRLEAALTELATAIDALPDEEPVLARLHLGYRALWRSLEGDIEGALQDHDAFEAGLADASGAKQFLVEGQVFRAELLRQAGDPEAAARLLEEAALVPLDRPDFRLLLKKTALLTALDLDGPERALGLAQELLEELWTLWRQAGAGTTLRYAADLGRLLADEFDEAEDAKHAFDLAARAALARIVELDRCLRELPKGAEPSPEDTEILADFHDRFAAEQGELLDQVARYLETRAVAAADLIVEQGLIAVCAWCKRVRANGNRWLPIASFIPREDQFDLTHGICESCRGSLRGSNES